MTKKVNIYPSTPIVNVQPVIRSIVKNATKDLDTIRKCIISRAKVEEVLPNGELVRLDLNNYDKDNTFANVKETTPVAEPENIPEAPVNEEKVEETTEVSSVDYINAELDNIELPEDNDVDDGIDNDEPGL